MVLVYGGCEEELGVKGYIDASFDTCPDDSKSQTGYMFMVNEGAMSWRSRKQSTMAQSIQWDRSTMPLRTRRMKLFG
jgi:hypothetical protein